ncbi:hypothetical protein J31TS4_17250 [Paenibacillus sp. J31TS4]|uniref:hypothetical protein n=1 Tax=Paenibacillus sp. J31TS4 TaxID=2807195 RepID=UPI001B06A105|nr:hypothetical protein [Paenibacillus sp. J31TS4]GIP38445.1 hypothetical protein J31TS4_17250 [Paenibacillus sp. J31TS4]
MNDSRIAKLTENNRKWLSSYISTKRSGQAKIKSDLLALLEAHYLDITSISLTEMETYINLLKVDNSTNTVNQKTDSFIRFFKHIQEMDNVSFSFDPDLLKIFKFVKEDLIKSRQAKPLKVSEITRIRHLLKDDDLKLFSFELAYEYGSTLEELAEISPEHYDQRLNLLLLGGRPIQVTNSLSSLIERSPRILIKRSKESFSDYFRQIGERAKQEGIFDQRGLTWLDIKATREQNFIRCSECGNSYENSANYWVLAQYSYDESENKWLICKSCGSKDSIYG